MSEKMKDDYKVTFIRGATTAISISTTEFPDAVVAPRINVIL